MSFDPGASTHHTKLIFPCAETYLLSVFQCFLPPDVRVIIKEMIMVMFTFRIGKIISQLTVSDRSFPETEISTGLIQGNRIEGGKHTYIRQYRSIILIVAVTVGRDVHDKTYMKTWTIMTNGVGIFCDLAAQSLIG